MHSNIIESKRVDVKRVFLFYLVLFLTCNQRKAELSGNEKNCFSRHLNREFDSQASWLVL